MWHLQFPLVQGKPLCLERQVFLNKIKTTCAEIKNVQPALRVTQPPTPVVFFGLF
jgi:hypothetical protein